MGREAGRGGRGVRDCIQKYSNGIGDLAAYCNSGAEHLEAPENGEIFPAGRKWN